MIGTAGSHGPLSLLLCFLEARIHAGQMRLTKTMMAKCNTVAVCTPGLGVCSIPPAVHSTCSVEKMDNAAMRVARNSTAWKSWTENFERLCAKSSVEGIGKGVPFSRRFRVNG